MSPPSIILNRSLYVGQGRRVDNILPTIGFQSSSWIEKACQVVAFDLGGRDSIRRIWAHYYAEVSWRLGAVWWMKI